MNKIFPAFFLIYCLVSNLYAAPLIFKAQLNVKESTAVSKAIDVSQVIDVSKYKKVRILIKKDEKDERRSFYGNIYGIEDNQDFLIAFSGETFPYYTTVIDAPPSKIKIEVRGQGLYRIFVWGY